MAFSSELAAKYNLTPEQMGETVGSLSRIEKEVVTQTLREFQKNNLKTHPLRSVLQTPIFKTLPDLPQNLNQLKLPQLFLFSLQV